ncbi:MAG TPA: NAD-dependent epimerase/dehydratase family protein [Bacteroidota bacterium]|nr:NAD-dependent epimerase/dehydratase family protein [Bacteroidota bacterium]
MAIRAIITGSTGMVGEGVLHECLLHPDVEAVTAINRRPCGVTHVKLREIIHPDFSDFSAIGDQLANYNAAFLCMGVSSVGMKEAEYRRITYEYTMALAHTLARLTPELTITYVSGVGTDSTEQGRSMWARVKGKTENDLLALPVKQAYMFRPGYIQPTPGLKKAYTIYKVIDPLYPLLKMVMPKYICTLQDIGLAMINAVRFGYPKAILEVPDIRELASR